tara:strand:+ start:188 stop:847 length:660 start_codon:yes stop_codon:yes gene_type:complete
MEHSNLPDCVLWDMDGTLIDQTESIVRCYHEVLQSYSVELPSPEAIKRSLGGPLRHTLNLFLPKNQVKAAATEFIERFPSYMFEGMRVLDGANELIKALHQRAIPQAILTNKQGKNARAVSAHCGFDRFIDICLGNGDTPYAKPDPKFTESALGALGSTENFNYILLIGDSPTDVATAQNYQIKCYGIATGSHSQVELTQAGATDTFEDLQELRALWGF